MDFTRRAVIAAATLAFTGLLATSAHAQSAMDQLNRAADGKQHTGTTFDGSPRDQRRGGIDTTTRPNPPIARPTPPAPRPVVTQSSQQRPQQTPRSSSNNKKR